MGIDSDNRVLAVCGIKTKTLTSIEQMT